MNGYGCRKGISNPLPWLFPIIFLLILTFMFIVWNRPAKNTYAMQDYSYVYENSLGNSASHSNTDERDTDSNSMSPPKSLSSQKINTTKLASSISKLLHTREKVNKKKLTNVKTRTLQATNRTTHKEKAVIKEVVSDKKEAEPSSPSSDIPTIFGITPTYKRSTQKVDLTSLCHTLMLVPRVVWIVIEDSAEKTDLVRKLLQRCKVESMHMNVKTPLKQKSRGVIQRNAGLNWIRHHCMEERCNGVVYFMDDDNKYDLRLFEEMRKTIGVSVFPVAFSGGLSMEGPECENGKAVKWVASYAPQRSLPIDMAGFAINVDLLLKNRDAVIGKNRDGRPSAPGYLEPDFLSQFCTRETVECRGPKEILVWHTKTQARIVNDNGPRAGYEVR